jgi:nucleoid-associated protein YgaU
MHKIIISLICCLLPAFAFADASEIRDNVPDRYIVVKGDTLWDISARFFKSPWKWPQIWGMNKDSINDPHWIYPGDVIVLDRTTGTLRVGEAPSAESSGKVTIKLSPKLRVEDSEHGAIPNIPIADIAPFLSQPLAISANALSDAPILIGTYEQHVLLGTDDIAYVKGLKENKGIHWQVYRPGNALLDPDSKAVLG